MGRWTEADRRYMKEALDLAARGGWRTHPNPMVGAVVVRENRVVGRGYHRKAGTPHAERLALRQAGSMARGATLYVTLEPCCHQGRTPPCTDAVLASGVSRVVAAMRDPNPRVAGSGFRILRKANLQVDVGLMGDAAKRLNEAFCRRIVDRRPWVILKAAISLDGKIATASGDSRWISSRQSRAHAHRLRDRVDAVLVGIGTILADDPQLTARLSGGRGRNPVRVILDGNLQIPLNAKALNPRTSAGIIVATTSHVSSRRIRRLRERGVEVVVTPSDGDGVSLKKLLAELADRKITTLLVEGGGRVAGSFLRQGLVDWAMFYVAPLLIGGEDAPGPLRGPGAARLASAWALTGCTISSIGPDWLIEGSLRRGGVRS